MSDCPRPWAKTLPLTSVSEANNAEYQSYVSNTTKLNVTVTEGGGLVTCLKKTSTDVNPLHSYTPVTHSHRQRVARLGHRTTTTTPSGHDHCINSTTSTTSICQFGEANGGAPCEDGVNPWPVCCQRNGPQEDANRCRDGHTACPDGCGCGCSWHAISTAHGAWSGSADARHASDAINARHARRARFRRREDSYALHASRGGGLRFHPQAQIPADGRRIRAGEARGNRTRGAPLIHIACNALLGRCRDWCTLGNADMNTAAVSDIPPQRQTVFYCALLCSELLWCQE